MCPECHIFSTTGAFLIAKSWTQPMVALRHDPTSVLPHMGWRQSSCHAMVMKTLESLRHFVGREPPGMSHPIASDRNVGGMERQPCCSEIVVYVSVYIYIYVCVSILENRQVKRLFIPPIQFLFFFLLAVLFLAASFAHSKIRNNQAMTVAEPHVDCKCYCPNVPSDFNGQYCSQQRLQILTYWKWHTKRRILTFQSWSSMDESCPFLPKHERVQLLCLVFQRKMKQGNNLHQWTTKFPSASNELKEARDILGSPAYNRQFLAPPARLAARPWPNGAKGSAVLRG